MLDIYRSLKYLTVQTTDLRTVESMSKITLIPYQVIQLLFRNRNWT
jgi:hypothetical protein